METIEQKMARLRRKRNVVAVWLGLWKGAAHGLYWRCAVMGKGNLKPQEFIDRSSQLALDRALKLFKPWKQEPVK